MISTKTKLTKARSSMIAASNYCEAKNNLLLAALSGKKFKQLLPSFKRAELSLGDILSDAGDEMPYVYFPTGSIISLIYTTENGSTAEMGMIGRCGMIGISNFLGGRTTPNQAIVQVAGGALKIRADILCREFSRGGDLQRVLLCFTQLLLTQISQSAACNRLHHFEQRFCRWLLFCHDCVMKDEIIMTQEIIAHLLGVRREGVTVAAGRLQDAGMISYARGHIQILDRQKLEENTCECYGIVKDEYGRLLNL